MSKEYTIAYLAMQMQSFDAELQNYDGYDLPVGISMAFGKAFEEITTDWDWSAPDIGWADLVDALALVAIEYVKDKCYPVNANQVVTNFLTKKHPEKFLKKYHYNIPTTSGLYGGFDDGIVEALNIEEARVIAIQTIHNGFTRMNEVLEANNLPTLGFDVTDLQINLE